MSSYTLETTPTVRRVLTERLLEAVATAAFEFMIGPLLSNPYRVGKQLMAPLSDRWSARCGTYRIIYRIDDKRMTVTVVDVDHRSHVYLTGSLRTSRNCPPPGHSISDQLSQERSSRTASRTSLSWIAT